MRYPDLSRHPLITMAALAVAAAGAALLVLFLVVVPLLNGLAQAPAQLGHAYEDYWNGVSQQFLQACEQTHRPDCQQYYGGQP